jgi:hypothetical protein
MPKREHVKSPPLKADEAEGPASGKASSNGANHVFGDSGVTAPFHFAALARR